MQYRRLGKSDLHVSAVGFGTCQLRLLPERRAVDTLLRGFELGVNLVHTGPDYGPAQQLVATAVAEWGRPVIVAAHGSDTPSEGCGPVRAFEEQFEAACTRFGSDGRLALFGIACIDDREAFGENVWRRHGMVEFLQRMKREGRLGATFCTTHGANEYVARLVASGVFDAIMLAYNALGFHLQSLYPTPGRHFESPDRSREEIFPLFQQHGVGLMVMKPLAGGLLCPGKAFPSRLQSSPAVANAPAGAALRWILSHPSVTCVVPGTNSVEEAEENARSGERPSVVDVLEQHALDGAVSELRRTVCSRCGKCEPLCSQGLPVSWLFRAGLINLHPSAQHEVLEHVDYFRLNASFEAPCASCTNQSCVCPEGIDIPVALTALHHRMVDLAQGAAIPGPIPGAKNAHVLRAASANAAALVDPTSMSPETEDDLLAERNLLRVELRDLRRELLRTAERLNAFEHIVDSVRRARAYKLLRRVGRWGRIERAVHAIGPREPGDRRSIHLLDGHASSRTLPAQFEPVPEWELNPFVHPLEAARGYDGHLVDLDGRDFVDFSSAWGANLLGYGYARVAQACADQARRYAGIGMPCPEVRELERVLGEIVPGAEEIRFGKNGSDVTLGAIRLARAVTRRERVLHRGYHGFHDWWMASTDCAGVPHALKTLIEPLPEFTPDDVDRAFRRHPNAVACVIVDPMQPPTPTADEVREIMRVCHRHGALFIVDEVVSGLRLAPGGMQEVWGIHPDLSCFGKGLANGLPLSALIGKQEYMRRLHDTRYGMTFEGEVVSVAAALATVREVLEKQVCEALADKGHQLADAYARAADRHGVRSRLLGPAARPHVTFEPQHGISARELRWLCLRELTKAGVLTVGVFNLCYTHSDADLEVAAQAFEQSLLTLRRAIDRGSVVGLLDDRLLQRLRAGVPVS